MAFLNDLSKKLSEAAGDAAEKAKDAAGIAKLKAEILVEQKKLQHGYAELGKVYYEMIRDQAAEESEVQACAAVKDALEAIAAFEAKIETIRND